MTYHRIMIPPNWRSEINFILRLTPCKSNLARKGEKSEIFHLVSLKDQGYHGQNNDKGDQCDEDLMQSFICFITRIPPWHTASCFILGVRSIQRELTNWCSCHYYRLTAIVKIECVRSRKAEETWNCFSSQFAVSLAGCITEGLVNWKVTLSSIGVAFCSDLNWLVEKLKIGSPIIIYLSFMPMKTAWGFFLISFLFLAL